METTTPITTPNDNVLAGLAGAMVNFVIDDFVLALRVSPDGHYMMAYLAQTVPGLKCNFQLVNYQYPGGTQAKTCIESLDFPGQYLNTTLSADGLANAYVLGTLQETLILNAMPPNFTTISIATAFTPPASQSHTVPVAGSNYFAFGFDSPLLDTFDVSVIG